MKPILLALSVAAATPALAAGTDVYDALKAMDGHWIATTAKGRTQTIDNSCARTGLFFVCEQAVAGTPAAIVIFLPKGHEEGKLTFRTQTLTAGGDRPGPWKDLTIEDGTWTYTELDHPVGPMHKRRTVVTHSGPNYMRAEVQTELKGGNWITLSSENLTRAP
ncbi:MAG TPA: hypothetical protein VIJ59_01520 [Caulobacteraceae bacterium]